MKFNRNGKLAKFYKFFSDGQLPNDFCAYFWGLVYRSVVIFIFGGGLLIAVIFALISCLLWLWAHRVGTAIVLGSLAIASLSVWIAERKRKIKIEILSETAALIKGKVDAVKNRYCPRIEWH